MNCNHCGSPVDPGKKFCGECGQPVAVEPPPTEAPPPIPDDIATELVPPPKPEEQWVLALPDRDPVKLGDSTLFGRGTDCDFMLDDTQASRRHALIEKVEEGFTLTDQDSSNGTFVNEERIYGPVVLAEGDVIRIGQTTFTFERVGDQPPVKAAAKVDQPKPVPVAEKAEAVERVELEPVPVVEEARAVEPVESVSQSFCPECGAGLTPGIAFCGECGYQLAAEPVAVPPDMAGPAAWDPEDSLEPQPINPKRIYFSRRGLGIGCGAVVALGLVLSCFLYVLDYVVGLIL